MNKIIITAHPEKDGFTHKIAESFMRGTGERGHDLELIDLYQPENFQSFLTFKESDQKKKAFQEKITQADELIFIFPIWWGTCPAVMKNFFDNNFTSGFAYSGEGGKTKKLLTGKTAKIFATCDAPGFLYSFFLSPTRITWSSFMLGFCGIKLKSFMVCGRMSKISAEERRKFLERAYESSKK
jgi:NAD(P)H dehydrogenase (quinone)